MRPAVPALIPALLTALLAVWIPSTAGAGPFRRGGGPADAAPPAWARPLHGGPVRVLFAAPAAAQRDAVELGLRLDADIHAVAIDAPEDAAARALGRAWDVVVLGGCDPDDVPDWVQQRIVGLAQVGAGVVLSYLQAPARPPAERGPLARWLGGLAFTAETAPITRGVAEGPGWGHVSDVVLAAEEGNRVVWLDYPGDRPHSQVLTPPPADALGRFEGHTENAWALAVRAVLWAARRAPETAIAGVADQTPAGPHAEEIPPDLPGAFIGAVAGGSHTAQPARPFRVVFAAPAARQYGVRFRVRPVGAPSLADTSLTPRERAAKGATGYQVELFAGPGDHWLDVWLLDGERVVDWHTTTLRLSGWPVIDTLSASKTHLLPNDELALRATVPPVFGQHRSCSVYARATDALGRVVAHRAVPLGSGGGEALVALNFADLISPLIRVEVFAVEGPPHPFSEFELIGADRRVLHFPVRLPDTRRAPGFIVASGSVTEPNTQHLLRRAAAFGVTGVAASAGLDAVMHAPRTGLRLFPVIAPFDASGDAWPCDASPAAAARTGRRIQDAVLTVWAGGTTDYLLRAPRADVPATACAEAIAPLLRQWYGDLDTLGAAWGARPDDWSEAAQHLLDETNPGEARGVTLARRAALARIAGGRAAAWRAQVRLADPEGRVGSLRPLPGPPHLDLVLPAMPHGADAARSRNAAWRALLDGHARLGWALDTDAPLPVTPDGAPASDFAPLAAWWETVGADAGPLLLASDRVPAPIVAYHNNGDEAVPGLDAEAAALGHRVDSIRDLANVSSATTAVLLLDHADALDDDDLRMIRAFVLDGGAVAARGVPGALDLRGLPRGFGGVHAALGSEAAATGRVADADAVDLTAWLAEHNPEAAGSAGAHWRRHRFGLADIVTALAPPGDKAVQAAPRFANRHARDLVANRRARGAARVAPGEAIVWASLPYAVKRVAGTVPESAVAGRRLEFLFQLECDGAETRPGDHLLRVDLETRDGVPRLHYRQWLRAQGGVAHGYIPLAINEAQGRHRVRVRDILSGVESVFPVTLLPNLETP